MLDDPYLIHMQPNVKPYHSKTFQVPLSMHPLMKAEVQCLVDLGIVMKVNFSDWVAPSFGLPMTNGEIHFVTDIHFVNKFVVQNIYSINPIPQILRSQQGFTVIMVLLDVNTGSG